MLPRRGSSSSCMKATCASSHSTSRRHSSTARSGRCSTCRRGPTGAAPSNGSRLLCVRADGSPGTLSCSTIESRPSRYGTGDNRIELRLDDGGTSSLWWATKNEWLGLIDVAGLELESLFGGFNREPFADDSGEYVFVARR